MNRSLQLTLFGIITLLGVGVFGLTAAFGVIPAALLAGLVTAIAALRVYGSWRRLPGGGA